MTPKDHSEAEELKPCPFCGRQPILVSKDEDGETSHDLFRCMNIRCAMGCNEAVYRFAWNTRHNPEVERLTKEVEELNQEIIMDKDNVAIIMRLEDKLERLEDENKGLKATNKLLKEGRGWLNGDEGQDKIINELCVKLEEKDKRIEELCAKLGYRQGIVRGAPGKLWCAFCGIWSDHQSGWCPHISKSKSPPNPGEPV